MGLWGVGFLSSFWQKCFAGLESSGSFFGSRRHRAFRCLGVWGSQDSGVKGCRLTEFLNVTPGGVVWASEDGMLLRMLQDPLGWMYCINL